MMFEVLYQSRARDKCGDHRCPRNKPCSCRAQAWQRMERLERYEHDPAQCSYCGITEDIHLLDGVLVNEQDSGKIACIKCYPEPDSWCPTGIEHIHISMAPSLKPLYEAWLKAHPDWW